ncbi:hypothetical protein VP01_1172g4 [Puccinia sorghi]|uniref:Uncharacterized protein n=1 Tax=Puccinia sorghi TaxID=27349 RepID=A0A0L6VR88_9BASI|nr:hypothetical protein VP01_1172g4 [Puccinia sorghi]
MNKINPLLIIVFIIPIITISSFFFLVPSTFNHVKMRNRYGLFLATRSTNVHILQRYCERILHTQDNDNKRRKGNVLSKEGMVMLCVIGLEEGKEEMEVEREKGRMGREAYRNTEVSQICLHISYRIVMYLNNPQDICHEVLILLNAALKACGNALHVLTINDFSFIVPYTCQNWLYVTSSDEIGHVLPVKASEESLTPHYKHPDFLGFSHSQPIIQNIKFACSFTLTGYYYPYPSTLPLPTYSDKNSTLAGPILHIRNNLQHPISVLEFHSLFSFDFLPFLFHMSFSCFTGLIIQNLPELGTHNSAGNMSHFLYFIESLQNKLAQLPAVDMQKFPGSFFSYSSHSPKVIQPIFDAQSLCRQHNDSLLFGSTVENF